MKSKKYFLPIVILFVVLNGFFLTGKNILQRWGADQDVLIIGNALLFFITILSFLLARRGLKNKNTHVFVRAVMGSIMIKLFVSVIAAFIYISIYKKQINKPALFACMGLYLVYTFLEVSVLTKQLKEKANAAQRSTS
jgi:fructose-specific phosphotransferase system IIC component